MAVPDWPTTYGYNLFLYPWQTWVVGPWDLFIEHGHRLLGALGGTCSRSALVVGRLVEDRATAGCGSLAVAALCVGDRPRVSWAGCGSAWTSGQLAMMHGCIGPAVLRLVRCLAGDLWSLRPARWRQNADVTAGAVARLAWHSSAAARLLATRRSARCCGTCRSMRRRRCFASLCCFIWFWRRAARCTVVLTARRHWPCGPAVARPAHSGDALLRLLVASRLSLGAGTWVVKYSLAGLGGADSVSRPAYVRARNELARKRSSSRPRRGRLVDPGHRRRRWPSRSG